MLNEDELRDALLLVFANKQDLPVSSKRFDYHRIDADFTLPERHERRRDHRQARSAQLETARLGKSICLSVRRTFL